MLEAILEQEPHHEEAIELLYEAHRGEKQPEEETSTSLWTEASTVEPAPLPADGLAEAALAELRALLDSGSYDELGDRLAAAEELDPDHPGLESIATELARRRQREAQDLAIEEACDRILEDLEGRRLQPARDAFAAAQKRFPEAGGKLDAARRRIGELEDVLHQQLSRAEKHLAAGRLDDAESLVDDALGIDPGSQEAKALRDLVEAAAKQRRQRAAESAWGIRS